MRHLLVIAVFSLLFMSLSFAQVKVVKPVKPVNSKPAYTRLGIGFGGAGSVLFLSRNIKENNEAYGYHVSLVYGGAKLFRTSLEYTQYKTLSIEPTWYNVKAKTVECNVHILARFSESNAIFYPMFGLSYNTFSGFYTGVNDFLNLGTLYEKNQDVVTNWWGLNVGTGYEYYFDQLSLFADYKMRIGVSEGYNELNIMDVCLSAGLRWNFRAPSVYRLFKGTRSRYVLDLAN